MLVARFPLPRRKSLLIFTLERGASYEETSCSGGLAGWPRLPFPPPAPRPPPPHQNRGPTCACRYCFRALQGRRPETTQGGPSPALFHAGGKDTGAFMRPGESHHPKRLSPRLAFVHAAWGAIINTWGFASVLEGVFVRRVEPAREGADEGG